MGGDSQYQNTVSDEHEETKSNLPNQIQKLRLKDPTPIPNLNFEKSPSPPHTPNADARIKEEESDSDVELEEIEGVSAKKRALMRELKALGVKLAPKPDYTKELVEPSWGDDSDEYEDQEMEEKEMSEEEDDDDEDDDDDDDEFDEDEEMDVDEVKELGKEMSMHH